MKRSSRKVRTSRKGGRARFVTGHPDPLAGKQKGKASDYQPKTRLEPRPEDGGGGRS